jgi:hypothetical protein
MTDLSISHELVDKLVEIAQLSTFQLLPNPLDVFLDFFPTAI